MRNLCFLKHLRRVINIETNTLYNTVFKFMLDYNIDTLPVSVQSLASTLDVELISLTQLIKEGFEPKDIFSIWGNEDGVVTTYTSHTGKTRYKIAYNDNKPAHRIRFTIMEELSHIILGHTNNSDFNMFTQDYNTSVYNKLDEEARMCAGFLLFSPKFYYMYEKDLTLDIISDICMISKQCASTRCIVYDKFKQAIMSSHLYQHLAVPIVNPSDNMQRNTRLFIDFIEWADYSYKRKYNNKYSISKTISW